MTGGPELRERARNFEQELEGGGEWWLETNGTFVVSNRTLQAASYLFDMFDGLTDVDGQVTFTLNDLICAYRAAINNAIDRKTDIIDEEDRQVLIAWLQEWVTEITKLADELEEAPPAKRLTD